MEKKNKRYEPSHYVGFLILREGISLVPIFWMFYLWWTPLPPFVKFFSMLKVKIYKKVKFLTWQLLNGKINMTDRFFEDFV